MSLLCKKQFAFVLAGLLLASSAWGLTVTGKVFLDRNGDGLAGVDEPGLEGIVVSDGREVVLTSVPGEYRLETEGGRLVFVSLPRGYRAQKSFYATAEAGKAVDFALAEWPETRQGPLRFVQITDIHVTDTAEALHTFEEDLAEINALDPKPAFVLGTGDFVNSGKSTAQYENYVRGLASSRLPVFNLPGNHDARSAGTMEHYHHYLGPDYYSVNAGECHLLLLNCLNFDAQQKAWIAKDLAAAPKGTTRVFALHYLPTVEQLKYMAELGGVAVLSGHWHGHRVQEVSGVWDLNTPPLRFGGIDRHPRSFRVVDVKGGKVTNELRLGGFRHHGVVVSPIGPCAAKASKLPVVVNAYDTRYEVASVECEGGGSNVSLKRASPWSWMGELELPAGVAGSQHLVANIRAVNGESWQAETAFQVENGAGAADRARTPLRLRWAAPTGGFIGISSPQAGRSCVAIGIDDKGDLQSCGVSAFAKDGRLLWHYGTDSAVKNNIAAGEGRLFATSVTGWLYALEESSGKLLWKARFGQSDDRWEVAATTVSGGIVHAGAQSSIAAFEARSGKLLWEATHSRRDWAPSCYAVPEVVGGKLIEATKSGIFSHDARTGKLLWKLAGKFNGCAATNDIVYTIMDNAPAALSLTTGKVVWTGKVTIGDTASAPALAGDRLIAGSADGRVFAFSTQDGSLLWSTQTGSSLSSLQPYKRGGSDVNSSPAVSGATVYVGASDGEVYALSLADGKKRGAYRLGVPIASSPLILGDSLYIGGYDGNLYAFGIGE
jgi:outer membrane protein assembly factor BamB